MLSDPFANPTCAQFVGVIEALLHGMPESACLEITLSPLSVFVAIAAIGIAIACLQVVVRALIYGRSDPRSGHADGRRADHDPRISLREAANQARAARLHRTTD